MWIKYVFHILQVAELSLTVDGLEKERDFYFGKLRDIEVICQDAGGEENPVLKNILEVLYATEVSSPSVPALPEMPVKSQINNLTCIKLHPPPTPNRLSP